MIRQAIPGFEVMPVGVARQMLAASAIEPRTSSDFQKLARLMNVDAVLVGSVLSTASNGADAVRGLTGIPRRPRG